MAAAAAAAVALPAAPAQPPPPIAVVIQTAQADNELFLLLDVDEALVVATPFLLWDTPPQPVARKSAIPLFVALRAFVRRCRRGPNAADLVMARSTSIFALALNQATWSRILSELRDSGLLGASMQCLLDLDRRIDSLQLANPANLLLHAGDLLQVDPFNPPPVVAAGRGRGRGGGGPPPAVGVPVNAAAAAGPGELRFLQLCSLFRLENPSDAAPLAAAAYLAGMLGPCSSAASRADEVSAVRTTATILRPNLAVSMGLDAASAAGAAADPALASRLPNFVRSVMQSLGMFRAVSASEEDLQNEALAGFRYFLGDESQKIAVEAFYILLSQIECALPQTLSFYLLSPSPL